jgi:hypothetical protein
MVRWGQERSQTQSLKASVKKKKRKMWWHKSVIPALERLKQEVRELQASLGYIARSSLSKKKKKSVRKRRLGVRGVAQR